MFGRIFKTIIRSKIGIFWSFIFPLSIGTIFSVAFKGVEFKVKEDPIDVVFLVEENSDPIYNAFAFNYQSVLNGAYYDQEETQKIFNLETKSYSEKDKVLEKIKDKEIIAAIHLAENLEYEIFVRNTSMQATIISTITETFDKVNKQIGQIAIDEGISYPEAAMRYKSIPVFISYEEVGGNPNVKGTENYYYTIVGMALIISATFVIAATSFLKPNLSEIGKRFALTPQNKYKVLIYTFLACLLIYAILDLTIFLYFKYALKVYFASNWKALLTMVAGTGFCLSFGFALNMLSNIKQNTKFMIITLLSTLGGLLAGMMSSQIKILVSMYAPFVNYVNPISIITEALNASQIYNDDPQFYLMIGLMVIYTIILVTISIFSYRRQKYESI